MKKKQTTKQTPKSSLKPNSRRRKNRGKGDYTNLDLNALNDLDRRVTALTPLTPSSTIGKMAQLAGTAAGSLIGEPTLGGNAASSLAKWFGYGDYHIAKNSLIPMATNEMMGAKFEKNGRRGTRITDREYIGDLVGGALVSGSSAFTNTSYFINPGNSQLFPWLSTIAMQFEQWEPHGIIIEFVSTSSTANTITQALGTVIAATDYDPSDAAFVSKIEMENADYANSTRTSNNLLHGIECDHTERGDRVLLVRNGAVGTESLKFYDLGLFQLATQGLSAAGINVGEIWISYDITFYKKQLTQGMLGNTTLTFSSYGTTSISTSNYFGSNVVRNGNLNCTLTGTTITFPNNIITGRYVGYLYFQGSATTPPNIAYTNAVLTPASWSSGEEQFGCGAGTGNAVSVFNFSITGPSAVLTLSAGTMAGTSNCHLLITQVPFTNLSIL